ncbi:MAG: DNA-binding protein [Candidatus Omnitrophica bacterium CG11_big_fil_rev_8_21_14_0_20_64_10]|nr:MAG: DNA-binding protein [Candidatus Omnitrophica bacterium CG11_big_fil_rev_8_21_14_0_20_64_10]
MDQPEQKNEARLMTIKEVAEYLAIHEMTLYTLLHESDIPAMKLGGQWRFNKQILDAWIVKEMEQGRMRQLGGGKPVKAHPVKARRTA